MQDCLFCKIANKEIPSFKVWENDKYLAFLDINPIKQGHILLIPKKHFPYLFDMPDEEYNQLMETAKKLSLPLKEYFQANRIGMIVEGLAVDHVHVHLVPINKIGELNPANSKEGNQEELKSLADKLIQYFNSSLGH
jgi:histidine triad (HIT) family protein